MCAAVINLHLTSFLFAEIIAFTCLSTRLSCFASFYCTCCSVFFSILSDFVVTVASYGAFILKK